MPVSRRRILILFAGLATWGVVVVGRLVQIQLVRHEHYVTRAAKQQERTLQLTPVRGSIVDVRGRILAESVTATSIYADPQVVEDPRTVVKRLAAIPELDVDAKDLLRRLKGDSEFAWIARQVTTEVADKVRALQIPGIYTLEEHRRSYPKGMLASSVLGYVGLDGEGLGGVERAADSFVKGRPGKVTLLRDARRGMYLVGGEGANAAVDGQDVVLTIDEVIQFITERALAKAVQEHGAAGGSAVVMDPRDGSILAMASVPTFDPNRFRDFPVAAWRNRAVQDLYEPGSTFKIVTGSAAIEEGVVTPSQILDCGPGYIEIANVRIREHGGNAYGMIPFEDVMVHSSNVGAIRVGLALGPKRFYRYIRSLGFGEQTGIGLPGEASGIVRNTDKWSMLSNAVMSIGQEIAVTPLQLVRAAAVVANGGLLVEPHIIDHVVDAGGHTIYRPPLERPKRVISERTAAVMNEVLKQVVARGTGAPAALVDQVVAGKTGTAQKAARGGYSLDKYVGSFVGYVPADRPRLVILVVIDEPHGIHYGGTVAAPTFREIAESTLRYLRVPPSTPLRELPLGPAVLAAFSQKGEAGSGGPITNGGHGGGGVPDLRGLDARDAIARATASGLRVETEGGGVVVDQTPLPGNSAGDGTIRIVLSAGSEVSQ